MGNDVMNDIQPFKICPMCATIWHTRDDFLGDQNLRLDGYQADFEILEYGLFYFTHLNSDCRSTMALPTLHFLDMYTGDRYSERKTGGEECPGLCLEKDQLDRCEAFCECAMVREVIQIIKEKQQAAA